MDINKRYEIIANSVDLAKYKYLFEDNKINKVLNLLDEIEIIKNETKELNFQNFGTDINDPINGNKLLYKIAEYGKLYDELYKVMPKEQKNLYEELSIALDNEDYERAAELNKILK